jgi:hypothetical protein
MALKLPERLAWADRKGHHYWPWSLWDDMANFLDGGYASEDRKNYAKHDCLWILFAGRVNNP